jgi:hypothetical protein
MRWHKQIRVEHDGVDVAAEIDAVIAVNHGKSGANTSATAESVVTVVQQSSSREPAAGEQPQSDPKEPR